MKVFREFALLRNLAVLVLLVSSAFAVSNLKQIAMIDLPGEPGFDGLAFANGMLVITHSGARTLDIFDPGRRRVVAQVKDIGNPQGVAVDERAGRVYVADAAGRNIAIIATKGWKVEGTVPLQTSPYALALAPDGKTLWAANWREQSLTAIDVAAGTTVRTVGLGGTPQSMVFDAERRLLYVSLQDMQQVVALDPNLQVVNRFKLVASQPTGLALDAAARRLYVAVRHAVVALALDTGAEVGRVAAPPGATSLWFDSASRTLYVGSGGGYVNLIRATGSTFVPLDEVHTDVRGNTLAYDPGRKFVYMPGGRDGKSKLLILRRIEPGQPGPEKTTASAEVR
jgi:YVTN family beta-propeller protein